MHDELRMLMESRSPRMADRIASAGTGATYSIAQIRIGRARRTAALSVAAAVASVAFALGAVALAASDHGVSPASRLPSVFTSPSADTSVPPVVGPFEPTALEPIVGDWSRPRDIEAGAGTNAWFACGAPVPGLPVRGATVRDPDQPAPDVEHVPVTTGADDPIASDYWEFHRLGAGVQQLDKNFGLEVLTYVAWGLDEPDRWGASTYVALVGSDGTIVGLSYRDGEPTVDDNLRNEGMEHQAYHTYADEELLPADGVTVWRSWFGDEGWNCVSPAGTTPWGLHAVTEVWVGDSSNVTAVYVDTGSTLDVSVLPSEMFLMR